MSARSMNMKVSSLAIAFCGALLLGTGGARADDTAQPEVAKKHADALTQGKNHEEAREATVRSVEAGSHEARLTRIHAAAMMRGMNQEDARAATIAPADSAKVLARVKRHLALLNKGATHEQAYLDAN